MTRKARDLYNLAMDRICIVLEGAGVRKGVTGRPRAAQGRPGIVNDTAENTRYLLCRPVDAALSVWIESKSIQVLLTDLINVVRAGDLSGDGSATS